MNLAIFRFLWRRHRISAALSSIAPILIGVLMGYVYPTYSRERALLKVFKVTGRFFGGDQMDLFSPAGAFTTPFQHPIVLMLYAAATAAPALALIAGERGRRGLDLLLATPLERGTLVRSVFLFVACVALMAALGSLAGAFVGARIAGETAGVPWGAYAHVTLDAFLLSMCLGAGALVLSVLAPERAVANLWTGVTVFTWLSLDAAARLWQNGRILARFTPYGYFRPSELVGRAGEAGFGSTGALAAASIAFVLLAGVLLRRRRSA